MAQTKKAKKSGKKTPRPNAEVAKKAMEEPILVNGPLGLNGHRGADAKELWTQARELEEQLEFELLADAVLSARVALEELQQETHTRPFERRRGLRLREKAEKVERAFNRLRALRRGELLPERHPDD